MVRILKRSTAIPADFDAIDGPDGSLKEDDDLVDQIQNMGIAGLGTENNEAIDEGWFSFNPTTSFSWGWLNFDFFLFRIAPSFEKLS
jgi:hypothetical protein